MKKKDLLENSIFLQSYVSFCVRTVHKSTETHMHKSAEFHIPKDIIH